MCAFLWCNWVWSVLWSQLFSPVLAFSRSLSCFLAHAAWRWRFVWLIARVWDGRSVGWRAMAARASWGDSRPCHARSRYLRKCACCLFHLCRPYSFKHFFFVLQYLSLFGFFTLLKFTSSFFIIWSLLSSSPRVTVSLKSILFVLCLSCVLPS